VFHHQPLNDRIDNCPLKKKKTLLWDSDYLKIPQAVMQYITVLSGKEQDRK
jgi:hypothetical protein